MARRSWVKLSVLVGVAVCLIAIASWHPWRPQEPTCNGRSLSTWLAALDDHNADRAIVWSISSKCPLTAKQQEAAEAIRHLGTNALPGLLRMLETKDLSLRTTLSDKFQRWGLLFGPRPGRRGILEPARNATAIQLRHRAALGIVALGPVAKPAIPQLENLFTNPEYSKEAALALAGIGPEGVAPLQAALTNLSSWQGTTAIWALCQVQANPPLILTNAAAGVTNLAFGIRMASVWALSQMPAAPELTVRALSPGLFDTDVTIRRMTVQGLGKLGTNASSAVPRLLQMLQARDLKYEVSQALKAIDPEAAARAGIN